MLVTGDLAKTIIIIGLCGLAGAFINVVIQVLS